MPSIDESLARARTLGLDRLDAQLLLLHALGLDAAQAHQRRTWLVAHGNDLVPQAAQQAFDALVQRRGGGEPLAYLTGHKEFFGLDLQVDSRVLVPRPDTETLVSWALEVLENPPGGWAPAAPRVVDLGTGSGAIALALKQALPGLWVDAVDASEAALTVARGNAQRLGLDVCFRPGNWLDEAPCVYHGIVGNPPYIAADDCHLPALAHEPLPALVAGVDGLDDIRHIVRQAPRHLLPGAWLLLEHGFEQAPEVRRLMAEAGLKNVQSRRDLGGHERCTGGQRAPDCSAAAMVK